MSKPPTYRFALYGRTGSGKTCLLSALAMARQPHPQGYTSTRVPLEPAAGNSRRGHASRKADVARSARSARSAQSEQSAESAQSAQSARSAEADQQQRRQLGDAWIEDAVQRLQRGELPRPNQASDFVMTFQYEFTTPEHHTFRIELADYSGELVNPRDLADADSLASQLREHLAEMDGLLVVAEAPRPDGAQQLSDELNLLRQAFVSLRGRARSGPALNLPVGLLITKWDRQCAAGDAANDPHEQQQQLTQFFAEPVHADYRSLRDDLRNGVTPENFAAFPLSALGQVVAAHDEDGRMIERPTLKSPLPSFGLEDGFVWAAQRCDRISLAGCEAQEQGLSWWRPRLSGGGRGLTRRAARLAARLPRGSQEHVRATRVVRRSGAKRICRLAVAMCSILLLALGSEALWDQSVYSAGREAAADPLTSKQQILQHEQWLQQYSASPVYQHRLFKLSMSKTAAWRQLQSLRQQRVERSWQQVLQEDDVFTRAVVADRHLQDYPNSSHSAEAQQLIKQAADARQDRENSVWWQVAEGDARRALERGDEPLLRAALSRLEAAPPHPDRETQPEHAQRIAAGQQLSEALNDLAAEQQWSTFVAEYHQHLDSDRHLDAAQLLAKRWPLGDDVRLEDVAREFPQQLTDRLPEVLAELIRRNQWNDAQQLVARLQRDGPQWPRPLQPEDLTGFAAAMRDKVAQAHDQYLYDLLRRHRTTTAARDYLDSAPLGVMRSEVERFAQWLQARSNPLDLTLVFSRIEWGRTAQSSNDNHVVLRVDERAAGEQSKVVSKPRQSTGELARHRFRSKLDDDIKLSVSIEELDFFGFHDDHGRGEQSVRVYDLVRGLAMPLRSDKYYHEAVFHLEGAPVEPPLPGWRAD